MASKAAGKQTTARKSARGSAHGRPGPKSAAQRVREAQTVTVDLPVTGKLKLPRPEELAYYVGLGVLAAAEIIDWPVALVLAAGHALTSSHHNRVAQELGEALDEGRAAQEFTAALDESGIAEHIGEALADAPV